jgi:hypothetical protein
VDEVDIIASYVPPRRWYDKYHTSGANPFFFLEWMERAHESSEAKYKGQADRYCCPSILGTNLTECEDGPILIYLFLRLLLDWIETIQAQGCSLWNQSRIVDSASLAGIAKSWLRVFEDETQVETEEISQLHAACLPSFGRKFGVTRRGHFCLIPRSAVRHDLVCLPYGSKVPFVFREMSDHYLNIGECHVHGVMNGEALAWNDIQEVEFVLR